MFKGISCGVLAGGKSARMGQDKALLPVGSTNLLNYITSRLVGLFPEVLVCYKDVKRTVDNNVRYLKDTFEFYCPLAGIVEILNNCSNDRCFIFGCDMPWLNENLMGFLIDQSVDFDVTCPRTGGELQVLHALYSVRCAQVGSKALAEDNYQVNGFFNRVKTNIIDIDETKWLVNGKNPFTNINIWSDYQQFLSEFS